MGNGAVAGCIVCTIIVLFMIVGIPLIVVLTGRGHEIKDPEISVIDTSVTTFNLTSDDRLLWVFSVVLRAYNPDKKDAQIYSNQEVSVRKGKHHPIADDGISGFSQNPLNDTLWRAEAVAVYKQLERKIAAELREDVANGAGFVNVYLSGWVGVKELEVTCKNVIVPFSKSTATFPKINCDVHASYPRNNNDDY